MIPDRAVAILAELGVRTFRQVIRLDHRPDSMQGHLAKSVLLRQNSLAHRLAWSFDGELATLKE